MFNKILIANRGEIALRIIRACQELGIKSVAVYSNADKDALHVKLADEAVCIGSPPASDSYLNMNNILETAQKLHVDAIHPGFGFLSENVIFVQKCEELNIKFIGPTAKMIALMGDKNNARQTMIMAGVPVVPGSNGLVSDVKQAYYWAEKIGYPVLIKASLGGGGKGMRIAHNDAELENAYLQAKAESLSCFNDDSLYMEKLILNPRHIEVQVLCDQHNNYLHLFERECSIQRNNQKMIEEAPVANLSQTTKNKLYAAALSACHQINYANAGTIEFVMDEDENFYFIEMNTRIQVEHPVTEMITGIDLIKQQILIAANKKLRLKQDDIKVNGHAIEVRINAEDPAHNFAPSPGKIESLHFPGGHGIRVDSAIYNSYIVPPYYDSMIVKIIGHGLDREEAISKIIRALEETDIEGIKTNVDFQIDIIMSAEFRDNNYDTSFINNISRCHDV